MNSRRIAPLLALLSIGVGLVWASDLQRSTAEFEVHHSIHNDVSRPLREIGRPIDETSSDRDEGEDSSGGNAPTGEGDPDKDQTTRTRVLPRARIVSRGPDPVAQRTQFGPRSRIAIGSRAPIVGEDFDSIGETMVGFNVDSAPPDTSMAVGIDQIMVMVNSGLVVHQKDGDIDFGPVASNSIWDGFGGDCEDNNDGDGIVRYDRLADRWIVSQFAVSGPSYLQCVAVSATDDATGAYNLYSFEYDDFPDYPKLSVWPDAYYISYNMFDGVTEDFLGAKVCATDREAMLAGEPATQICRDTSPSYGGLLAADVDSETPPPVGAPNTVVGLGYYNDELAYWKFHPDFDTPGNSTFTGPEVVDVALYFPACYIGGVWGWNCVEQKDTGNTIDALDDRLMNRLAYRNLGDQQSFVVTHAVRDSDRVGVRWYELGIDGDTGDLVVNQQGTFVPDSNSRWMSSAAMDQDGNIAIGYSKSSSSMYPAIAYTGRLADDPEGTLTVGETIAQEGGGSQSGTLHRWGDYSTMNIDPADDCTFWFATEYLPATGAFNWATHVSSFSFPDCGDTYDFSLELEDDSFTITPSASQDIDIDVSTVSGTAQDVTLDIEGLPTGVTADFSPDVLTEDGTSTLTLTSSSNPVPGTTEVTVSATAGETTREASFSLTVTSFGMTIAPTTGSTTPGGTINGNISSTVVSGFRQNLNLSASGLPTGTRVTFSRSRISAGARGTFRVITGSNTPGGTYTITITAAGTTSSVARTFTLTVSDFSISLDPSTASTTRSTTQVVDVDTSVTSGSTQALNLSLGRLPRGVSARFSSTRVNAGSSPTLTITVGANARPGTYTITVSARGTTKTKTANFTLTITG